MEKFVLAGFYKYVNAPNGFGGLTGEFELAEDGSFEGSMYDHASSVPEQSMNGFLRQAEGLETLLFFKSPPSATLANLAYHLQKQATGTFEGKYVGEWGALPFKVGFSREYDLFVAQIDMSVCGIGDHAELTLYKK